MKSIFGLLICLIAFFIIGCSSPTKPVNQQTTTSQKAYVFLPPIAPVGLDPQQAGEYMLTHYWDRFDFADTLFVSLADSSMMLQAFAHYAALLTQHGAEPAAIDSLMLRASSSRSMLSYFGWLGEQVLREPNSPLRNDELYIPVVKAIIASPFFDQYEKMQPQYRLHIASQNRVGQLANDLRYTLHSGAQSNLYAIRAQYTLLFINNPGCDMCKQIREAIISSPMLSEMIERGRLKVLAFYPDQDLTEWHAYRDMIPASWINSYDKGCVVSQNKLYNLEAIPSLYLLDSQKRVLIKDSVDIPSIEEVIVRRG